MGVHFLNILPITPELAQQDLNLFMPHPVTYAETKCTGNGSVSFLCVRSKRSTLVCCRSTRDILRKDLVNAIDAFRISVHPVIVGLCNDVECVNA